MLNTNLLQILWTEDEVFTQSLDLYQQISHTTVGYFIDI